MSFNCIVQARIDSVRFPGKVLSKIGQFSILEILSHRLKEISEISETIFAIPNDEKNDVLSEYLRSNGFNFVRGSKEDVLDRYLQASIEFPSEYIIRITGDSPLIDIRIVKDLIKEMQTGVYDYVNSSDGFPDGTGAEIFTSEALKIISKSTSDSYDREHVTPYFKKNAKFSKFTLEPIKDLRNVRLCVDEPIDLKTLNFLIGGEDPRLVTTDLIVQRYLADKNLPNVAIRRNEGSRIGTGQKLWKRAVDVIPGGNMFLSKHPDMNLPGLWPVYFDHAKGCEIWDLDGIKYLDMGLMGVGTNILGYANDRVDDKVIEAIKKSNMSSLNPPEEVTLAERLIEIHPWARMAKFTKTGGEATALAIRIARSHTSREEVVVTGYHGWHDWYLSANLSSNSALNSHHLSDLDPVGVPKSLIGLTHPVKFNDISTLEEILIQRKIACIIMEVHRNVPPEPGYLESVRKLATMHGAVLIFDECTSAFRKNLGGLHLEYGVDPDLLILGKTLGNGYPICAVIGISNVMNSAKRTFISSTFWSERSGLVAGLESLQVMEETDACAQVNKVGQKVRDMWVEKSRKWGLQIEISGLPALSRFKISGHEVNSLKTFVTQELIKKHILGGTAFYASISHTPEHISEYSEAVDDIFKGLSELGQRANLPLETQPVGNEIRRLN